jgi:hypothetical protein
MFVHPGLEGFPIAVRSLGALVAVIYFLDLHRTLSKIREMCQPIGRKGLKFKREWFLHSLPSDEFFK